MTVLRCGALGYFTLGRLKWCLVIHGLKHWCSSHAADRPTAAAFSQATGYRSDGDLQVPSSYNGSVAKTQRRNDSSQQSAIVLVQSATWATLGRHPEQDQRIDRWGDERLRFYCQL